MPTLGRSRTLCTSFAGARNPNWEDISVDQLTFASGRYFGALSFQRQSLKATQLIPHTRSPWLGGNACSPQGQGCEEESAANAGQQLAEELMLATGFGALQPWDPACRSVSAWERRDPPHQRGKGIFVRRMVDLVRGALN